MTNEELKKKIKEILRKRMTELLGSCHTDEIPLTEEGAEAILFYADEFADALIAAGIGDVEQQHYVFKKTYMDFIEKLHYDKKFLEKFDNISLGCKLVKFEDMLDKNKKELAEERKDE